MDVNDFKLVKVNRDFLAEIFDCDVRSITNFVSLYGMPKDDRGEYPLFDCLIWFINKQKNNIKDLQAEDPLAVARKEAIELNNQKKRLEIEKQLGNLIEVDQAEISFVTTMKMLMTNLESVAPRLNKKINGDAKTLSIIREEISDFRTLCASTPVPELVDQAEYELNKKNEDF